MSLPSDERFSLGLEHSVLTGSSLPSTRHPVLTRSSLPCTHHPVLTGSSVAGYSTSGSHRVFHCRVLHIRFSPDLPLPGTPHPDSSHFPSGGTCFLTLLLFSTSTRNMCSSTARADHSYHTRSSVSSIFLMICWRYLLITIFILVLSMPVLAQ